MIKTHKILILLITTGILLFSLAGCGALLNGDKQLTADVIHAAYTNSPSSSNGTLKFYNMYYLTDADGSSKIWITFKPFSFKSTWTYLFPFDYIGSNTYCLHNGPNDSSYNNNGTLKLKITDANQDLSNQKGYERFSTTTSYSNLYDAYVIGKEHDSGYSFDEVSNLIKKEDIVYFNLDECLYYDYIDCPIEHVYSSSYIGTDGQESKPVVWTYIPDYTNCYLWVHLKEASNSSDGKSLWVNLGYVGGNITDINPSY